MSLKFEKTTPKKSLTDCTILIHGEPKSGKTTLASHFIKDNKEPLFLATEDGHHELGVYCERISDWNEFRKFVKYVKENIVEIQKQFSCIVLDLVSDLDYYCDEYTCKKLNISALADAEWGKGFKAFKHEFRLVMKNLMSVINIVFICHSREKEGEDKVKRIEPYLSGSAFEFINAKVDLIGYITTHNKTPIITFKPNSRVVAGSRIKNFQNVYTLNPEDMKTSFEEINTAFTNRNNIKAEEK